MAIADMRLCPVAPFAAALIAMAIGVAWTVLRSEGVTHLSRVDVSNVDIEAMPDAA